LVPLIIASPLSHAPKRIAYPVSLIDLVPTILDWAGIEIPPQLRGRSILDSAGGSDGTGRTIVNFSENALTEQSILDLEGPMHSILTRKYKYINYVDRNKELLFNIDTDPEENLNLADEEPDVLQNHRMMAQEFLQSLKPHAATGAELTEELSNQLKALGYIQ